MNAVEQFEVNGSHQEAGVAIGRRFGDQIQSSRARLQSAQALCQAAPLTEPDHVLSVLGDRAERDYPIYRTANPLDDAVTLCTALYNLEKRLLRIYVAHAEREPEQYLAFDL